MLMYAAALVVMASPAARVFCHRLQNCFTSLVKPATPLSEIALTFYPSGLASAHLIYSERVVLPASGGDVPPKLKLNYLAPSLKMLSH